MVLKLDANTTQAQLYLPLLVKAVTICSEIISPPEVKNQDGNAAVESYSGRQIIYYLAQIYINGSYDIWRRSAGSWITVVPRTKADSIRQGPNAVNQLKVTTGINAATLTINGTKIIDFRGQTPNRGWMTGLYGQSEEAAPNEWRFSSIAVIKDTPEKTPSAQTLFPPKSTASPQLSSILARRTHQRVSSTISGHLTQVGAKSEIVPFSRMARWC